MSVPFLDAVLRLSAAVGSAGTLPEIFDAALDGLQSAFGVRRASILLFDADGVIRFKAWRNLSDEYRAGVEGHTPWAPGQEAPEPIVVSRVLEDESLRAYRPLFEREQIQSLAFVPLVAGGRVIGKFMLYGDAAGALGGDETAAARTMGFLIGFAVERTRATLEARREQMRLALLADGAHRLVASLAAGSLVEEVLGVAAQVIAADGYAVWRRDGDVWRVEGSRGLRPAFTSEVLDTTARGFRFDRPIVAADLGKVAVLEQRMRAYLDEGIESLVSVPLIVLGETAGSIVFYYRRRHEPGESELRVAVALGHLAAAAITNAELYAAQQLLRARAEAAQQRAAFLAEASASLSSLDYEGNLRTVARLAVPRLCDWCAVDLVGEGGRLERLAITHVDPEKVTFAEAIHRRYPVNLDEPRGVGQVLRTGRPELFSDIPDALLVQAARDDEHLRILREVGLRSAMLVPLSAGSRIFGVISFVSSTEGRHYHDADLDFAAELGRRAGFAIENARLFREAQSANRVKDEFLATLSHELRTPLNVILGRARMLADAPDLALAKQLGEIIERNGATLARLVEDLLDMSRMTLGQVAVERQEVHLPHVVDSAIQAVQAAAAAKQITIRLAAPADLAPCSGDPTRLQQVVWNLLANAVKFTPPAGRIDVEVTCDRHHLTLRVADSGEGIAPDALPRVFDMFWQAEATGSRRHGGLGIGLSIVRRLVELHGGRVFAESAGVGRGATFTVVLPCVVGAAAEVLG